MPAVHRGLWRSSARAVRVPARPIRPGGRPRRRARRSRCSSPRATTAAHVEAPARGSAVRPVRSRSCRTRTARSVVGPRCGYSTACRRRVGVRPGRARLRRHRSRFGWPPTGDGAGTAAGTGRCWRSTPRSRRARYSVAPLSSDRLGRAPRCAGSAGGPGRFRSTSVPRRWPEPVSLARATALARDLANTPSNVKNRRGWRNGPTVADVPGLSVTVRDDEWLAQQRFGGMLAVGAVRPSATVEIQLSYRPRGAAAHCCSWVRASP